MNRILTILFCFLLAAVGTVRSQSSPNSTPAPKPRSTPGRPVRVDQPARLRPGQIARPTNMEQAAWPNQSRVPKLPDVTGRENAEARDLFERATKFLTEGKPDDALPLLGKLEKLEPKRFEVHYVFGVALAMAKRPDDAASAFQRAIGLNAKSADAYSGLCQTLAATGRRIDAIDACREATRLDPNRPGFRTQLAGLYLLDERSAEAIRLLEDASRVEQADLFYLGTLADAYYANGEYARAAGIYERIVQSRPTVSLTYLRLSGVYDLLERPADAIAAARKFAQLEPKLSLAHFNLGMILQASGFFFESIDSLVATVDLDRANGAAYLALSESYETVGDKDNELGSLRHAYKYLPRTALLSYRLGRALSEHGFSAEAVEPLERTFELLPAPDTMRSLGFAYIDVLQYDKGIELIEKAAELSPLPPGMSIDLTRLKNRNELLDRFDQIVEFAKQNPNSMKAHYELGEAYLFKGMVKETEREYLEMLRLAPGDYRSYNGLGIFYTSHGQIEKALGMFRKAAELNPHHVLYLTISFTLMKLGKLDEALEAAKRSVEIKSTLLESRIALGDLWLKKGNRQEALREFQAALLIAPNDLRPNFRLVWLYIRMGDKEAALRQYRTLKALAPDQTGPLELSIRAHFGASS